VGCLGGPSIELSGWSEAFDPFLDDHLALLEHVHALNADQRALSRLKGFEPQHGLGHPLHGPMILLHQKDWSRAQGAHTNRRPVTSGGRRGGADRGDGQSLAALT
jgi:hypothetical protein